MAEIDSRLKKSYNYKRVTKEEKIFEETTTGSPHAAILPLFQPVLAETE